MKQLSYAYAINHSKFCIHKDSCRLILQQNRLLKQTTTHSDCLNAHISSSIALLNIPDNLYHHIKQIFKHLIDQYIYIYIYIYSRYPTIIGIHLLAINFIINEVENLELAIEEVNNLSKKDLTLVESSILYHLQRTMDDKLFRTRKGVNIDLSTYICYDQHYGKFKKLIKNSTNYFLQLWSLLQENTPDSSTMKTITFKIGKVNEKIDKIYNTLMKISSASKKITNYYSNYIVEVLNDESYAKELFEK